MEDGIFMSNSNLKNFDNFYADLAQAAYNGRPSNFPPKNNSKKFAEFYFSKDGYMWDEDGNIKETTPGGKNLPHDGKVYLQPDPDLHSEGETMYLQVPNPNGGYHKETYVVDHYQKGLLTDEKAGFNAYFLTDTPTLGKDTQKTYMTIRGSDGFNLDKLSVQGIKALNLNDCVANDGQFAINSIHIS